MAEALAGVVDFAYRVPQLMGFGDHWPLQPNEAKNLGRALDGCLRTIPVKSRQKAIRQITRWLPWISLTTTAYIVTVPRINMTALRLAAQRGANRGANAGGAMGAGPDIRGEGAGGLSANGGAAPLRTWADYRPGATR